MYEEQYPKDSEQCLGVEHDNISESIIEVPQHLTEPVETQAQHIFLQDTIVLTPKSSGVSHGHYAKLVSLLRSSLHSNALCTAVNAVALASLATRFGIPEVRPLAAAQYASSIRCVRAEIELSRHGDSRECLFASISLLSLYEVC